MINRLESYSVTTVQSLLEWESLLEDIEGAGYFGLNLIVTGPDPLSHKIQRIFLALPNTSRNISIYIADIVDRPELKESIVGDLAGLLEERRITKVLHDAKSVLAFIRKTENRKLNTCNIFDIMLASQICWSGYYYLTLSGNPKNPWTKRFPNHSLASLAERHLGIVLDEEGCPAQGTAALLPLHGILAELLARNDLCRVADLEFRAAVVLAEMEISGIGLDSSGARELLAREVDEVFDLVRRMQDEAERKGFVTVSFDGKRLCYYLNPDRQEDVMAFLAKRGYKPASTKAEVLKSLAAAGCSFAEALMRYRHLSYNLVFLNKWLEKVHPLDGRVHPQYFQIPSSTGRISSRHPNAQQIPRRGDDAPAIRRLFRPAAGKRFVKADLSNIELRIMARISGDEAMQEAFINGIDLHRLTASRISGIPFEEVTDSQRHAAKAMNFLLIYGGSAKSLQWRILSDYGDFICLDEAEERLERFFCSYPGVREWQKIQLSEMSYTTSHHFHNCVRGFFSLPLTATRTILGRRRIWPRFGAGITASKFQMYNTPCQGTGADLIKLVMAEVYEKLSDEEARIVGSIHDEIILEVPEEKAEEYASRLKEIMERIGSEMLYPVPVKAEAKVLSSLAE